MTYVFSKYPLFDFGKIYLLRYLSEIVINVSFRS